MIKTFFTAVASFAGGNKIWLAIICALVGIIIGSCVFFKISNDAMFEKISDLNIKLAAEKISRDIEKSNLKVCGDKLEAQNAKFKELQAKPPDAAGIKEKIVTKFKRIKEPLNDECQSKLRYYEELINEMSK